MPSTPHQISSNYSLGTCLLTSWSHSVVCVQCTWMLKLELIFIHLSIYDVLLTFDEEVDRIWKRRVSTASILFLLNRYCNILIPVGAIVSNFGPQTRVVCVLPNFLNYELMAPSEVGTLWFEWLSVYHVIRIMIAPKAVRPTTHSGIQRTFSMPLSHLVSS